VSVYLWPPNMRVDSLSAKDFARLSNFRTGLRKYLINSRFYCDLFDLTEIQYVLLLNIKMLEVEQRSSFFELKKRLNLTDSGLNAVIKRLQKSDLLEPTEVYCKSETDYFRLTANGSKIIEFLAFLHNKEFEIFKTKFSLECSSHCTSPVCWKGTD
jgi:DNA-binding MarR family transcriptional regulator